MNSILRAVSSGYTSQQILGFIRKAFPDLAPRITRAVNAGHSIDKIVGFLTNIDGKKGLNNEDASTILGRNNRQDAEIVKGALKTGATLAGSALGTYALGRALPAALSKVLPEKIAQKLSGNKQPTQDAQSPQMEQGQQQLQPNPSEMPQENAVFPQEIPEKAINSTNLPQETAINASDLFEQMGIANQIKQMATQNSPDTVSKVLDQHLLSPGQKKWLKSQTNLSLPDLVSKFLSESPKEDQTAQSGAIPEKSGAILPEKTIEEPIQKPIEAQEEISKQEPPPKSTEKETPKRVFLPNGDEGKIISQKNGISAIEVNGETKHRKTEDLVETDLSDDELADLYEKALHSIPKRDRSNNLFWGGYDEATNRFAYLPHAGALYIYDDVPQDLAKKIKEILGIARTSGTSPWGAWTKGEPSRGSAMFDAIAELKSREKLKAAEKSKATGKEEKPEKEYSGKFKPVFETFGPQQQILKKRKQEDDKKRRKEEKEKNEKGNQEKRRKKASR